MGKLGRDSLIRRVKQFDTVNVAPDQKFTVDRILTKHDETAARIASAGCGTFYVWVCLQGKIPTYFIIIIIQKDCSASLLQKHCFCTVNWHSKLCFI